MNIKIEISNTFLIIYEILRKNYFKPYLINIFLKRENNIIQVNGNN